MKQLFINQKIGLLLLIGLCHVATVMAQTRKISGRVVAQEDQAPLPGASIGVKGTNRGTQVLPDGSYSLQVNPGETLVVRYTGYLSQEIPVTDKPEINIKLEADVQKMGEVVVVGYGTQNRRNITSAIAKLDNQVLANAPRANVGSALQGTVSGLQVVNSTGQPGAAPVILLRGGASINSPGAPLVVVDGIIRPFNDIATGDIASIELLKDAASTAIYGARANNGVILITTKQGKAGKGEINYRFVSGYNKSRADYAYMGARDYIYYNRLGNLNSGISRTTANNTRGFGLNIASDQASFDIRPYGPAMTNLLTMGWDTVSDPYGPDPASNPSGIIVFKDHGGEVNDIIFRNTHTQNHYISAMGGNEKGKYFSSFDYYKEDGVVVGSGYKRFTGDINGSYKVKPNIEVSGGTNLSTSSQLGVNGSEVNNLYRNNTIWPTFNPWIDSAKTLPNPGNGINDGNPLYWLDKQVRSNEVNRITAKAAVRWDLLPGLYINASGSIYLQEVINQSFTKATQTYTQINTGPLTSANANVSRPASSSLVRDFQQTYNGIINYTKSIKQRHNIGVMLGAESYTLKNYLSIVSGTNAPTDDIPTVNASTTFVAGNGNRSQRTQNSIISYFGRLTYDYNQKYLLSAVLRSDGVSNLSKDKRRGYFPGMSAGWNVHNEEFFQDSRIANVISTLKPRISYGVNGNIAGIGPYDVQGVYASQGNYNGNGGFLNTSLATSELQWEKSKTIDAGLDIGLLKDRVSILFDYYDRRTSNLLTDLTLPSYIGFAAVKTNLGTLQNKGYEVTLNTNIINNPNGLKLDVAVNGSFVKNKILKLPYNGNEHNRQNGIQVYDPKSGQVIWVGGLQEGQPLGAIYGYKQVSIFKDDQEVAKVAGSRYDDIAKIVGPNLPLNANNLGRITAGDVNWLDVDRNDTINTKDQVYLGNINPKWTGGFSTTLSYKGFTLYTRFEFALGYTVYNDLVARTLGNYQGTFNYLEMQKDAWSPENTNADIPKVYSADQRAAPQGKKNYTRGNAAGAVLNGNNSRFYEKGDYLACRELTLSYDFSKSLLEKTKILSQARVFGNANNLFYVTKFTGPTPEPPVAPGTTTINGIYQGTYPTPQTFVVGVQVSF
ncbi:SusC/RagA family TonB-linked outer membrane protein [Chitinophaga sp. MM2321]|uniref:SusC/RagA family TonB-linked outer membrane protein n=1 Tax=Chitinophaga sp. MM2321 TaxID=3137178 RepID=UPI0032D58B64